jgi:hypothetical protein
MRAATPLTTRPKARTDAGRTLTIRLPEEVLTKLDAEASARVLSRTKLAELLLIRGLAGLLPVAIRTIEEQP